MPPPDKLVDLTTRFIRQIQRLLEWWLIGEGKLFYQAGFSDEGLTPVVDLFGQGALQWSVSRNLDNYPSAATKTYIAPRLPRSGAVRLTIEKPIDPATGKPVAGIVSNGLVAPQFSASCRAFKITATFERPVGPHGTGDRWAVVDLAREGEIKDLGTAQRRIGATLQSLCQPFGTATCTIGARLNVPFGTLLTDLGLMPQLNFDALFNPPPSKQPPTFTLELRADRVDGRAVAWLSMEGYLGMHLFTNDFVKRPNPLDVAGINLSISDGVGPVAVTLLDLRMFGRFDSDGALSRLRVAIGDALISMLQTLEAKAWRKS
jgi:hypothetical protein